MINFTNPLDDLLDKLWVIFELIIGQFIFHKPFDYFSKYVSSLNRAFYS